MLTGVCDPVLLVVGKLGLQDEDVEVVVSESELLECSVTEEAL